MLAPGRESRALWDLGPSGVEAKRSDAATNSVRRHQQKVVVGRWLHSCARSCVRDPTGWRRCRRQAEIYRLFDVALQAGAAIVVVSTDFEEVAKGGPARWWFDRGRVVAELAAATCRSKIFLRGLPPASGLRQRRGHAFFTDQDRGRSCVKLNPAPSSLQGRNCRAIALAERSDVAQSYGLPILTIPVLIVFLVLLRTRPDRAQRALDHSATSNHSRSSLAATCDDGSRIDLTIGSASSCGISWRSACRLSFGVPGRGCHSDRRPLRSAGGLSTGSSSKSRKIDFVHCTLGTGTILYASRSGTPRAQIIRPAAAGLHRYNTTSIAGIPIPASYVLVLPIALWIVSERLPVGRICLRVGANEESGRTQRHPGQGLRHRRVCASGMIAGLAGCVLAARAQDRSANVGLDYLLPRSWRFSRSTTISPPSQRLGHDIGVLILAVGIPGSSNSAERSCRPLVHGTTLVISIALAASRQRRRTSLDQLVSCKIKLGASRAALVSSEIAPITVIDAILTSLKRRDNRAWRTDGLPASHREERM